MEKITLEVFDSEVTDEDMEETTNQYVAYYIEEEPGDGENLNLTTLEEESFVWNHSNTLLFLDEFQKRIQKYRNPCIKKKTFWKEIAAVMSSKGQKVDGDVLDRKMRNMKATFNKIKDNNKKSKTGRGKIQWEYFDRFNEIFAQDKTVNITNIISSNTTVQENSERENVNNISTPLESPSGSDTASNSASNSREKQKRLDLFRKRQIELEEQRVEELHKIRLEMSESNRINREKLKLFQRYLEQQNSS